MPRRLNSRFIQRCAMLAAAALLLAAMAMVAWPVRRALLARVLEREAVAVAAVAHLQRDLGVEQFVRLGIDPTAWEVFDALLASSRLEGVVALQLFGANGQAERELPLEALVDSLPVERRVAEAAAYFHAQGPVEGAGELLMEAPGPWLEVVVPLTLAGAAEQGWARYWIDGRRVAVELEAVDDHLLNLVAWAGGIGAIVLVLGLGWAFARLRRQAEDLTRANRELLLHTKTAAIGAISSHLIHGLKNPLAGLDGFMADLPADGADATDEAWQEAVATTRRVRALINEVIAVLQEEDAGEGSYPVRVTEVVAAVTSRVRPAAERREVCVVAATGHDTEGAVDGRSAALAGLVLNNLIDNAVVATPAGGEVRVGVSVDSSQVSFSVSDDGPGLPQAVRDAAFAPVSSTKPGGAGLGLALSGQLARHAGGRLALVRSDARGTVFQLNVPMFAQRPQTEEVL